MKHEIYFEEVEALLKRVYDNGSASRYYTPDDPAILYEFTLKNNKTFTMILLKSDKEKIEKSQYKDFIKSISSIKPMFN